MNKNECLKLILAKLNPSAVVRKGGSMCDYLHPIGKACANIPIMVGGKISEGNLPSYVDDVIEGYLYEGAFYSDAEHTTEITGEAGKIYVDLGSTGHPSYRFSGSVYVRINDVDISGKADKVVRTSTSETTLTLGANTSTVVTGTPTALAVTLGDVASGIDTLYRLVFTAGAEFALTVNAPTGITVLGADDLTFTAGNIYEMSFALLDNTHIGCICKEWEISA